MRLLDLSTTAGSGRPNEDRAGHRGSLAWVIDGATDLYEDAALPAERDVLWLVDFVAEQLTELGAAAYRGTATALLTELAGRVADRQQANGFPPIRLPPACSLAVLVDRGGGYEIARVGDATAVVTGNHPMLLATDFFDQREKVAVAAQQAGQTFEQVRAAMLRRREHYMIAGDVESVFSGHPDRQLRTYTSAGTWNGVEHIMLFTDGFARLVTDYALYDDWPAVVEAARTDGLPHLEKLLREFEQRPMDGSHSRFKRADDAAALLVAPDHATGADTEGSIP